MQIIKVDDIGAIALLTLKGLTRLLYLNQEKERNRKFQTGKFKVDIATTCTTALDAGK